MVATPMGDNLEQRIKKLEDGVAIRDCWYRYLISLDSGDWEGLGDVFTTDATVITMGFGHLPDREWKGRKEIIEKLYTPTLETKEMHAQGLHKSGHMGTNMKIDFEGDDTA